MASGGKELITDIELTSIQDANKQEDNGNKHILLEDAIEPSLLFDTFILISRNTSSLSQHDDLSPSLTTTQEDTPLPNASRRKWWQRQSKLVKKDSSNSSSTSNKGPGSSVETTNDASASANSRNEGLTKTNSETSTGQLELSSSMVIHPSQASDCYVEWLEKTVGLFGQSGVGKTTFLQTLSSTSHTRNLYHNSIETSEITVERYWCYDTKVYMKLNIVVINDPQKEDVSELSHSLSYLDSIIIMCDVTDNYSMESIKGAVPLLNLPNAIPAIVLVNKKDFSDDCRDFSNSQLLDVIVKCPYKINKCFEISANNRMHCLKSVEHLADLLIAQHYKNCISERMRPKMNYASSRSSKCVCM